jgi:hypothetical protein
VFVQQVVGKLADPLISADAKGASFLQALKEGLTRMALPPPKLQRFGRWTIDAKDGRLFGASFLLPW